jgi:hypothetical protein
MRSEDCGVCHPGVTRVTGLTGIDHAVRFIKQAGAQSEAATSRPGFLSHATETHAVGAGLGVGFTIAAAGNLRYFGLLYESLLVGNRGDRVLQGQLLEDIKAETAYFLGGLIAGAALGMIGRYAERGVSGV